VAFDEGPRRFLIATATARYRHQPDWDRPGLVQARQDIIDLFTQQLGYRQATDLRLDPTERELTETLRAFCRSPELREDDLVAVYIAGHGEVLDELDGGGHVLLTHDTDPDDITDALQTEHLARKMLLGTRVRNLLLMLDTCYSGQGNHELTATALTDIGYRWTASPGGGLAILSSAQPLEQATTGHFPRLLREAIGDLAVAGRTAVHPALDAVVTRMNQKPGPQRIGLTMVGLTGEVPPFLAPPRRGRRPGETDPAVRQDLLWQQEADRRDSEFASRLRTRAMGSGGSGSGWWFTGRTAALQDLALWLTGSRECPVGQQAAVTVTGGPGVGKTAVLGLLATMAHPAARSEIPLATIGVPPDTVAAAEAIDVAVYAQGLSDRQVLSAIAAAARVQAATVGDLLDRLSSRPWPLTVLIDGLDEAATPNSLCAVLLRPLIHHAAGRVRLLLGTRPHLLPSLGLAARDQIDLDADRYADPDAVAVYAIRNLIHSYPESPYRHCPTPLLSRIAQSVATAAGGSFLVARLSASVLAATPGLPNPDDERWRASLPQRADEAMAADIFQRFGQETAKAVDLLRPLAYAQGQGLPWEGLWAGLAGAISGRRYTDHDIRWLHDRIGSYIVETAEADRSVFRLYHQAMSDHLRTGQDDTAIHAAFAHALTDHVPLRGDGTRDWARAHPYVLRYLAAHAIRSGGLDEILTDPEYLVHADPDGLTPYLNTATAARSRLAAAVYAASVSTHRSVTADQRRQILALDAARYNHPAMLAALNSRIGPNDWKPLHATGGKLSPALRNALVGHTAYVNAVACTVLEGRPVAVTGSKDCTVRVWDLATGQPVGQPLTGHTNEVEAVACTVLEGRPVAVTGSKDCTVRVWDLTTGGPAGGPYGLTDAVNAVACTYLDGRPVVIASTRASETHILDVADGRPASKPLACTSWVRALACTTLDGRPVVVTACQDYTAQVWDLTTGRPVGRPIEHDYSVESVACTMLNDRPVAVTSIGSRRVTAWDLVTGRAICKPFAEAGGRPFGWVCQVACITLDDRPVVVTGSSNGSVRVWDLATGQPLGPDLRKPGRVTVFSLACTVIDGRPVAVVSVADDNVVRVLDLYMGRDAGQSLASHADVVRAVACTIVNSRTVAVTASGSTSGPAFGSDYNHVVRVWDLATGQPFGQPFGGHTGDINAIACTVLDGRPVAVTGSDDRSVRVWDLITGRPVGRPFTVPFGEVGTVLGQVDAVACTLLEGSPVAVVAGSQFYTTVWDLRSGQCIRELRGPRAIAIACTEMDGRPIAIAGGHGGIACIWDLISGKPIGKPVDGHGGSVHAVACTVLDGKPVAVTGSKDRTVRVWDLFTGRPVGRPLIGHTDGVISVACAFLNGRPIAITSSHDSLIGIFDGPDHTIRVWDLVTFTSEVINLPAACSSVAAAPPDFLVCASDKDIAVFTKRSPALELPPESLHNSW
jgi:WD40 repeat protein